MKEFDKLKRLLQAAEIISEERDTDKLLIILSDLSRDLLEVDRCSIFLLNKDKKELWTKVAHGVSRITIPADKGIAGFVATTGKTLVIHDAYKDPRFNKEIDMVTGYKTRNILAIPLYDKKGNILGVFEAINKKEGTFTKEDVELFTFVGAYAASVIENSLLYKKIYDAYKEAVLRLSYAAEYKDPETYNHIVRIGLITRLIAEKAGYRKEDCENVMIASPMHDIGKIGIPDSILTKPGRLDEREWKIMKKHTLIGYEILKDSESELLQMAAIIALEHHERWDGKGYPHGKKGKEINPFSRMTTVADVFDALTSKRPYKEPWPLEKVIDFVKENREKIFDPEFADILIENMDDVLRIKERYGD